MSTDIRPVLSDHNKYAIERHRYYELKHFCLQYPIWVKAELAITAMAESRLDGMKVQTSGHVDILERCRRQSEWYLERIHLVERCCEMAGKESKDILLKGVTEGLTYDKLYMRYKVVISRDEYYKAYRYFFYLLNESQKLHV